MKNLFLLLWSLLLWNGATAAPVEAALDIDKIVKAFEAGNSEQLSTSFNSTIEITTPTSEGVYSKVQAKQVMTKFFTQYAPNSVSVLHKGTSNTGSTFVVLTYKSKTEEFRITVFLKQSASDYVIQEIDIEK
jgi:hypothetical protein